LLAISLPDPGARRRGPGLPAQFMGKGYAAPAVAPSSRR